MRERDKQKCFEGIYCSIGRGPHIFLASSHCIQPTLPSTNLGRLCTVYSNVSLLYTGIKRSKISSKRGRCYDGAATLRWILQQLHSMPCLLKCTYRCIFKQMHYKTPFSRNGYEESMEFYENYITLFYLGKKTFLTISY